MTNKFKEKLSDLEAQNTRIKQIYDNKIFDMQSRHTSAEINALKKQFDAASKKIRLSCKI